MTSCKDFWARVVCPTRKTIILNMGYFVKSEDEFTEDEEKEKDPLGEDDEESGLGFGKGSDDTDDDNDE